MLKFVFVSLFFFKTYLIFLEENGSSLTCHDIIHQSLILNAVNILRH
jgi:hypothetical protein